MEKIRVLHLITKFEFGGAQQNTLYTVSHLNTNIFEVLLASGKSGYLDKEVSRLPGHVKIHWLRFLGRTINPFGDLFSFIEILRLLFKTKPDIVHTHSSKAGILGRWAGFLTRTPIIIHTFHGFGFHEFQPKILKLFLINLEKLTAAITTQLIYVSQENKQYAESYKIRAKNPGVLIRSGISFEKIKSLPEETRELKRKELYIDPNQTIVVSIGNLKKQKNPKDFIELARRLERRFPKALFLFIGGGDDPSPFYDAPDNLRYLDWREDALAILKASDIFVLTSLWEGLPRSAVEALCSGLPICAYATDGIREIVKHGYNGLLAQPKDMSTLTRSLEELLRSPSKRAELAKNAKTSISQEFDINLMVKNQEELYRRLAAR